MWFDRPDYSGHLTFDLGQCFTTCVHTPLGEHKPPVVRKPLAERETLVAHDGTVGGRSAFIPEISNLE